MISDLPVFQINNDTDSKKLMGSFMELSYLSSDANGGDEQTRYKSMAIPLGTLYRALMAANSGDDDSMFVFPQKCTFKEGFDLSGDIYINNGFPGDVTYSFAMKMRDAALSCANINLHSSNSIISQTNSLKLQNKVGLTKMKWDEQSGFTIMDSVNIGGQATCETDGSKSNSVVNVGFLNNKIGESTAKGGILFEIKQLDYINDSLSSNGWIRLNADQWLSASQFSDTYSHLTGDYEGGSPETESHGGSNVSYIRAKDGHKII